MKKWTDNLPDDVYDRLRNCRTIRSDLPTLVNSLWLGYKDEGKDKRGFVKEDALVSILELLDCNSCSFDLTEEEYNELCH